MSSSNSNTLINDIKNNNKYNDFNLKLPYIQDKKSSKSAPNFEK